MMSVAHQLGELHQFACFLDSCPPKAMVVGERPVPHLRGAGRPRADLPVDLHHGDGCQQAVTTDSSGGWHLDADGYLEIPSGPGLGVALDRDAIEKYGTRPAFADPQACA